jgi:TPR repeat protein
MYRLGMTYLLGATDSSNQVLITQDIDKGVALLKDSAGSGYFRSQWALAVLYQAGFRVIKPDKELSDKYWKLFASQSAADVACDIGLMYSAEDERTYIPGKNKYMGRPLDYKETNEVARQWFEKAISLPDDTYKDGGMSQPESMYNLGLMYRDGRGAQRDLQKAIAYFKHAAELGDYPAMRELVTAYLSGSGVAKNYPEALKWALVASNENEDAPSSKVHMSQYVVGELYENGVGTDKDLVLAYAWYNVAAAGGLPYAKEAVTRMEALLTSDQLKEAQIVSSTWSPGQEMRHSGESPTKAASNTGVSTDESRQNKLTEQSVGSGFFISASGYILTNNHVIADCTELRVPSEGKVARTIVTDAQNDLAVLKLDAVSKPHLTFPTGEPIRQGEDVYVFGFPLEGFLPASGNFTPGMVAALAGPGNNASLVQITAPVQPGNSGGPVIDSKGHVVGVVVGKADALKIAKAIGDIPENVSFSVAPQTIQAFLAGNQITFEKDSALFTFNKSAVEIADLARQATVKVECWR